MSDAPFTFSLFKPVALTILFALSLLGCSLKNSDRAPVWQLPDLDGSVVKSEDFAGKVQVITFWATWHPSSRQEIPGLIELQTKYGKDGVAVIGITTDEEAPIVVKPFLKEHGINYIVLAEDDKIELAFGGLDTLPCTFVINRNGKIAFKHIGPTAQSILDDEIQSLLKLDQKK